MKIMKFLIFTFLEVTNIERLHKLRTCVNENYNELLKMYRVYSEVNFSVPDGADHLICSARTRIF